MADPELLDELGATTLAEQSGTRVHSLGERPGTYVIAVTGTLDREVVTAAISAIYDHAGAAGPKRVVFWEAAPGVSYERDVLEYYENNPHKDSPQPQEVSVVTTNRMIRMVVSATAIGFRVFTGRRLRAYTDLREALTEAESRVS